MELTVHTATPYQIVIRRGCLPDVGLRAAELFPSAKRTVVVGDSNTIPLYGQTVVDSLTRAGFSASAYFFPAGEGSKRLSTVEGMLTEFVERGLTRTDFVVALGGGVTGDMAGFAAASYLRGVPFIQIPTSLLAQVDSSVGGKTGVDLPQGKNLAGAFWQPSLVLIDPDTLRTLPPRFFTDGMGEVIKYGCIRDKALFERLEREQASEFLEEMIRRCVDCKRIIVEHDEREKGERMLLNFGHTLGHALEKVYHYETLTHGEAVGVGMVQITNASQRAGLTEPGTAERIAALLQRYGLPVSDPSPLSTLAEAACSDKKSAGDSIRLVLLREIGDSFTHRVSHARLSEFLTGGTAL
ncbi:MAG: 3-dehydroquinate synthase [Clostridiales bacterium]|jgi:3-dehydroquinate synthase|nr:3-dehydroquinate synthase [Clostridiales bacterium]